MITRYRLVIGGMFEPVARELQESGLVEVERSSAAHVFFTVADEAIGLARPTDDGWAVEVLLADRGGGMTTHRFAVALRMLLQDYDISGPTEVDGAPE